MAIRRLDPHANTWRSQILYSMLCDFYGHDGKSVVQRYNTFAEYVRSQSLENLHERVPIINGRKMADVLQTKTGPWMKGALDLVMAWHARLPSSIPGTSLVGGSQHAADNEDEEQYERDKQDEEQGKQDEE
jgi:tRNA nucleotidyltransferase (CCA-adding enzyme)